MTLNHTANGGSPKSRNNDRELPREYFDALNSIFNFTIDAAASAQNALLPRFWSKENSALDYDWKNERVYCNPPFDYNNTGEFFSRAVAGGGLAVFVLPNNTDAAWWHKWSELGEVWLPPGRIQYLLDGKRPTRIDKHGKEVPSGNPKGTSLFIYGPEALLDEIFVTPPLLEIKHWFFRNAAERFNK